MTKQDTKHPATASTSPASTTSGPLAPEDVREELSRRRFLAQSAAATLGTALSAGPLTAASAQLPVDPTKIQGAAPSEVGSRAPYETPKRQVFSNVVSRTPLQDLYGSITPADLHFERHHGGIPAINPDRYQLLIHGLVERPMTFSLKDLKRFPSTTRTCFIECSGNNSAYYWADEKSTPQYLRGLTSQSEWTGVKLSTLFREVRVNADVKWFLAEGSDAAVMTRSIPVEKAWDDAMIAYAQNGEAIRPEQGYPARLLLPGWEGNTSVKWLRRIELARKPFMTREETSKYSDPMKDGSVRQFSFTMDANSLITSPVYPEKISPGWVEIRGLAWSGHGRIKRVELSTDGGQNWKTAELQKPVLEKAHTRFRYLWKWDGKATQFMSRAIDETGYVQPTKEKLLKTRSVSSEYHLNSILIWKVNVDGNIFFQPESWT